MSPGSQAAGSPARCRMGMHGKSARMLRCHPHGQAAQPSCVRIR